jgi:hypothetical protein
MQDWLEKMAPAADIHDVDHEYRNLLTRIIGFLLISPKGIVPERRDLYNLTEIERKKESKQKHYEKLAGPTPNLVDNPTKEDQDFWEKEEKSTKSYLGSLQARFMLSF